MDWRLGSSVNIEEAFFKSKFSEKEFSEPSTAGSRTHDLPEYRLDALTTGHILSLNSRFLCMTLSPIAQ